MRNTRTSSAEFFDQTQGELPAEHNGWGGGVYAATGTSACFETSALLGNVAAGGAARPEGHAGQGIGGLYIAPGVTVGRKHHGENMISLSFPSKGDLG